MALAQVNCPPDEMLIPIEDVLVSVDPRQVTVIEVLKVLEVMDWGEGVEVPQIIVPPVGILTVVPETSASALKTAHSLDRPTVSPTFDLASARLRAFRNWGRATAESRPMIATTIISSTKVKPPAPLGEEPLMAKG